MRREVAAVVVFLLLFTGRSVWGQSRYDVTDLSMIGS